MLRKAVIKMDQVAFHALVPGRLLPLRLDMPRTHDFFCVYQYGWTSARARPDLLADRKRIWDLLADGIRHIPKSHMMLVAGDFNTPLTAAVPHVCTPDKKFAKAPQSDRMFLQELISELRLVAPHCKQAFRNTFVHGTHASRIDYMFLREHQLRWKQMNPVLSENVAAAQCESGGCSSAKFPHTLQGWSLQPPQPL